MVLFVSSSTRVPLVTSLSVAPIQTKVRDLLFSSNPTQSSSSSKASCNILAITLFSVSLSILNRLAFLSIAAASASSKLTRLGTISYFKLSALSTVIPEAKIIGYRTWRIPPTLLTVGRRFSKINSP